MSEPNPGLLSAAEELASRIRHHASVLAAPAPDPAEVVAAADAVGIAAEQYSTDVFDLTGWGSPFTAPPAVEDDFNPADGLEEEDDSVEQIRVSAEYVLEVASEEGLRRLVVLRELQAERPPDEGESTVVDFVAALFQADGWRFEGYDRDVVHGFLDSWSIGPVRGAADTAT